MASPLDQLTESLRSAIAGAIADCQPELQALFDSIHTSGSTSGGTSSGDVVAIVLGLVGLGLALNPEIDIVVDGLKGASEGLGSSGQSLAIGYFLAQVLLPFAEPYTRQVTHVVESAAQSQIFDPATAADMAARQIITENFGQSEAGGGGFDSSHWTSMLDAARTRPSWDVALRLWNRGYVQEQDVETALKYGGIPEFWWPALKAMRQELLTPADLALAVLRQTITNDQGVTMAAQWGLSADDFTTLLYNTGEPLSPQELNMALRRGFITQERYEQGIRESRIRDDWIPTALALRYSPMSVAEAANGVTRGYLTEAEGAAIAQQNGLEPDSWPTVLASNGRPPSHEQMMTLFYRGLVSRADVVQAVKESDIKDEYIDDVIDLGVKLLPLFEAVTLLKDGYITPETFSTQMLDQGYAKATVDEITKTAATGGKTTAKHLTVTDIQTMYESKVLTHDKAAQDLVTLGYTDADAESLLSLADVRQATKLVNQQISTVKTQYDKYRLTAKQATDKLTAIGITADDATKLVADWTTVRPDGTRELTETQVIKLLKDGLIKSADAVQRLQAVGYTLSDAELLIAGYAPNAA